MLKKQFVIATFFFFGILSISGFSTIWAQAKAPWRTLTVEQWRDDLQALADSMRQVHRDLDALISPQKLSAAVQKFDASMPDLSPEERLAELMKLTVLLKDGHSGMSATQQNADVHFFPIFGEYFSDGFFIRAAKPPFEKAIGARLIKVHDTQVDSVLFALHPLMSAENDFFKKVRFGRHLPIAELLLAEKIIPRIGATNFVFEEDNGEQFTLNISPIPYAEHETWRSSEEVRERLNVPWGANDLKDRKKKYYGFNYLADSKTLFVYMDVMRDQPDGETSVEFARRLKRFVDANEFDRFVLDLRSNGGGSANIAVPLVELISRHQKINRKDRLFTIISAKTYSAAMLACGMLENRSKTIFVGEPSGQGVNLFGDARIVTLPNSKLKVHISERWWQCSIDEDARRWIEPDLPVELAYKDFLEGHDPALEAILRIQSQAANAALPITEARKYVGRYRFSPYQTLELQQNGGRLSFTVTDHIDGPNWLGNFKSDLYPLNEKVFATDISGVTMTRAKLENGRIEALVFDWRGVEKKFPRLPDKYTHPLAIIDGGNISGGEIGPLLLFGPSEPIRAIESQRLEAALKFLTDNKANLNKKMLLEHRMNIAGYRYLRSGEYESAIRVFQANVALFPKSWNVYDSLAEAYMVSDDKQRAIDFYRKSLALNPDNGGAKRFLKKLGVD